MTTRSMLPIQLMAGGPWAGQHPVTTKIPPFYNGTTSWFAFEEAVEDWLHYRVGRSSTWSCSKGKTGR
eukprot:2080293-Amphidinium_carterae.1